MAPTVDRRARARDWAEIQERMLVPLYEAVYERLEVGPGVRLLELGCGSGLALLMAAARGAAVTGVDTDEQKLALARERLLPEGGDGTGRVSRLLSGGPAGVADPTGARFNLVTVFSPVGCTADDAERLRPRLAEAAALAERGSAVVLSGWGPPERCATAGVLRVAARLADPARTPEGWRPVLRDNLEEVAVGAGLQLDGSGRVACPFGYADVDSAVRGLQSTGLFDAAISATDAAQVEKELTEALHPYVRLDGTVWMPNVFRYLIARTP
jgi:SAM-dependent methyltransferase